MHDDDCSAYYDALDSANQRYLGILLAKINVEALRSAACRARGDEVSCEIPAFDRHCADWDSRTELALSQCGGQNCNLDLNFADGVTWIARIRLEDPLLPPPAVQRHIFLSEVATLRFLMKTAIPSPSVFAYALESPSNPVGTSYLLMEKLPGRSLDWNSANADQRAHIVEQLVDVYIELEKHPLQLTGSLELDTSSGDNVSSDSQDNIGSFTQPLYFSSPTESLGPFSTLKEAYEAIITRQMQFLSTKEVHNLPVDNYLSFLWRLSALPKLIAESASANGPFYLKHNDDKGDHILVDDDYNITGIVDWEFASFEAKEYAFSSPCMMWPVRRFYDGANDLVEEEKQFATLFDQRGRPDLGDAVRHGRQWQRFLFALGETIPADMDKFKGLFQGLRKSLIGEETIKPYEEWKKRALEAFANDPGLSRLLKEDPQ
ncbi:hypothetical protein MBLNU457_g0899t1 [Dothideomycetes sp. NU457]